MKPESAQFKEAMKDIEKSCEKLCPDVILFLCKAKEVDAHIAEDIKAIIEIKKFIATKHTYEVPVQSIVTQVDELDPKRIAPPYDDSKKKEHINKAVEVLDNAIADFGLSSLQKSIPVSAYADYDENDKRIYNQDWNIDKLTEYLIDVLPSSAGIQFARLSCMKNIQKKMAEILVHSTALLCSGIAAIPIPIADIAPLTILQTGMVTGIIYVSGRDISKENVAEFLVAMGTNVGMAYVLKELSRALVKILLPFGPGELISAGIAYAGTYALGKAATAYFIEGASKEDAKKIFKKGSKKLENKDIVKKLDQIQNDGLKLICDAEIALEKQGEKVSGKTKNYLQKAIKTAIYEICEESLSELKKALDDFKHEV